MTSALLFGRKKKKLIINEPDPEYQVTYLGNVLTPMARNDLDKPLALIWRTYCGRTRPDLPMNLRVSPAGLKARTKQQGLTEYWAHRVIFCWAPPQYPKLFCWVYKHEGKKMKPEMRCHAVLCKKLEQPEHICKLLQEKISVALLDYKREKLAKQNLRLSSSTIAQATGYQPAVPRRRLMLSTNGHNFRPPIARSKSAPRLHSIDEDQEEEEEEDQDVDDRTKNITQPMLVVHQSSSIDSCENGGPFLSRLTLFDSQLRTTGGGAAGSENFINNSSSPCSSSPSTTAESSSSSNDASPVLGSSAPPYRRRDSTFDFMRISAEEDEDDEADKGQTEETNFETESDCRKCSSSSTNDDDSISDESGYHEEKITLHSADVKEKDDDYYEIIIAL